MRTAAQVRIAARLPVLLLLGCGAWGCSTTGAGSAGPDFRGAMGELVAARRLLEEPATTSPLAEERYAAEQADVALGLIRSQYPKLQPAAPVAPPDPAWTRVDRLHFALQHFDAARGKLTREEYDADRHRLRNETISAVARAQESLGRALEALLR